MYPFLTLDDNSEIVHSQILNNGEVKVYIETPDENDGFHSMTCFLPSYRLENMNGYSSNEIQYYLDVIKSKEHIIIEHSKESMHMCNTKYNE